MKKILVYIPSFEGGGAERVAAVLTKHWRENFQYQVLVINTLPAETDFYKIDKDMPRRILKFNYSAKGLEYIYEKFTRVFLLREALKESKCKTVISFMSSPSVLMLISSIGLNKSIICCEHTNYYGYGNKFTRFFRNMLYLIFARKVTVLTTRDIKHYPTLLRKKLIVLPNPLGVDGFRLCQDAEESLPKMKKVIRLLFVGRLTKVKGIGRLCSILENLKADNWHLTICGDGEEKKILEEFIIINNLTSKVDLVGPVVNIHEYYLNADLLIMTSLREGLPMVIAEAMSFNLPVIAFDCPTGPREFIRDGLNGLLVSDGDINAYIKKLDFLISNPTVLYKMSLNTKSTISSYKITEVNKVWSKLIQGDL
ncbi:glycosyltransferase [Pseudoalteromonas nigrifaciens]|uniref:glycosyltransferase n=1 Tax=Pseudoalteromonas nigrifaciens TaxID=28109 RepID=UPI0018667DA5|nr:glycosyltransferase [Pseudoalteromonas nigrifaciens]